MKVMLHATLIGGLVGTIVLTIVVAVRLSLVIRRYRYRNIPADLETLPTVSVCIPARNETHAMTTCLERILVSDYERLEIIVLDDSSVDDTSVLIKSFAHEGVRFVEGSPLPKGWLGKNHALQGLLEEASGSLVLYLDVDTIIHPDTISRLVSELRRQQASFLSVMPQRQDGLRASVFLGALRYFWPLILPAGKAAIPTSGSCMLVDRKKLLELGGFTSTEASIEPETELAHRFRETGEHITYLISSSELGVSYEKKWSSQIETSIRLLKPLFGSALASIAVSLALIAIVTLPIVGLIAWLSNDLLLVGLLALVSLTTTTVASLIFFKAAWRYGWWLGALHWPYTLIQEATLTLSSVIAYGRRSVTWKGRPVRISHL